MLTVTLGASLLANMIDKAIIPRRRVVKDDKGKYGTRVTQDFKCRLIL